MPQPSQYPDWALVDETSTQGAPNKVEIPQGVKNSGIKAGEDMIRPYYNQQLNLVGLWVRHLEEEIATLNIQANVGILNLLFPPGKGIWIVEGEDDPATHFGLGVWERVERFLVGKSDNVASIFNIVGATGGAMTHIHSDTYSVAGHQLTTEELPVHSHEMYFKWQDNNKASEGSSLVADHDIAQGDYRKNPDGTPNENLRETETTGSSIPHYHGLNGGINSASSLPPYKVVDIWKRVS